MENHRHVTRKGGAGRKRVDGKAKTQSSATTVARGGEAELFHRKGKRLYTVVLCYSRRGKITWSAPRPEGGGRQVEKETNAKNV